MREIDAGCLALSFAVAALASRSGTLPSYEADRMAAEVSDDEELCEAASLFEALAESYRKQGY